MKRRLCGKWSEKLRYKNWVKFHLAAGGQVRGMIIAQHISDRIRYAIANDPDVIAQQYQLHLSFHAVPRLDLASGSVSNDSQA